MPLPVFSGSLKVKMNLLRGTLLALAVLLSSVLSSEVEIVRTKAAPSYTKLTPWKTQKEQNRQQCNGMYSKTAWGGSVDPFILTKFIQATPEGDEDPVVSLVIFEWKDEDLVGVWPSEDAPKVGTDALHF